MPVMPHSHALAAPKIAVEVVVTRLDAEPEEVPALALCLSEAERKRAQRFHFDRDRRRFIVSRAGLRRLLGARLGVAPEAVELRLGKNGKPALAHRPAESDWRFNLSHCDDVAVYGFCRGGEIGIDVEAIRAVPEADAIAAHFFSRREYHVYLRLAPRDKPLGFFSCWTRKEAFVKALGEGLSMPLDAFDVSLAPGEPAELLRVGTARGADAGWWLHSFSPLPGFIAALASHQG